MTAQFSDQFVYKNQDYSIAGINGEGLFSPYKYGLSPHGTCTACWKGFITTYALEGQQLILYALDINIDKLKRRYPWSPKVPSLNGVKPSGEGRMSSFFDYHFEDIGLKNEYNGGILIGSEFIMDLYVHMGYHPAWKYEKVHELIFEKGILVKDLDISDKMKEYRDIRKRMEEGGGREPDENIDLDKWIENCFSLKY